MTTAETANTYIGWMIKEAALELGYDAFFKQHVYGWRDPKNYESPRALAKEATHSLPDYCSFDAFYSCFESRFKAWHETGDYDSFTPDPEEE